MSISGFCMSNMVVMNPSRVRTKALIAGCRTPVAFPSFRGLSSLRGRFLSMIPPRNSYCPRCSPPRMSSSETGNNNLGVRVIAGVMLIGLIASSFLPVSGILRNSFSNNGEVLAETKLHKVPVFTVTDGEGRPFLVESDDHLSRRGYFFVDPRDAEGYLERVKQDTTDAKLLPVGLDEALNYVMKRKGNAKQVSERFTLFPSEREVNIAREVTNNLFAATFGNDAIPLFYVEGLAFADASGETSTAVYPVFFEKETLDKTLAALQQNDPASLKNLGEVQVTDLMQTVKEIKAGTNPRLERVVFLPMENSLKSLQSTAASMTSETENDESAVQ